MDEVKEKPEAAAPKTRLRYKGRLAQIPVYLGKCFRMFVYQNDWKVIPMAALIAGLVSLVGGNLFKTMEGTVTGSFAIACICIWNGFFNSIQVVCRERAIVKREHRGGMHISSYVAAHMIYQSFLCALQVIVTVAVCYYAKIKYPAEGLVTPWFQVDFAITLFLITYAADMTSLAISSFVKNTTTAMTVMPFLLIFQLVFSGAVFTVPRDFSFLSNFTVAKWGLTCICSEGFYNELPFVTVWNTAVKFRNIEIKGDEPLMIAAKAVLKSEGIDDEIDLTGTKPVYEILAWIEKNDKVDDITKYCGKNSQKPEYASTTENVYLCWRALLMFILVFAGLSVLFLEFIDLDKR